MDTIFMTLDRVPLRLKWYAPPREPASDPDYIKHVCCEGARFHVLSYSNKGTRCSEPKCIVNKRYEEQE